AAEEDPFQSLVGRRLVDLFDLRLDILHPPLVEDGVFKQVPQVRPRNYVPDDVEHAVRTQSIFHPLQLLEQTVEDLSLTGVLRDEVPSEDLSILSIPLHATHPLRQPVWIPRDVVIDHQG